jgi:hypothetical protein
VTLGAALAETLAALAASRHDELYGRVDELNKILMKKSPGG